MMKNFQDNFFKIEKMKEHDRNSLVQKYRKNIQLLKKIKFNGFKSKTKNNPNRIELI